MNKSLLLLPLIAAAQAQESSLSIEIPRLEVAEYHRPYVAAWVESSERKHLDSPSLANNNHQLTSHLLMKHLLSCTCLAAVVIGLGSQPLMAHRVWMFPSTSVLSGDSDWVTFDAAVSNDLFFPNHHSFDLSRVTVTGPDGQAVAIENGAEGEYRSTFDLELTQPGSYRVAAVYQSFSASWEIDGERQRWRGSRVEFADSEAADQENLQLMESTSRVETFVTLGAPNETALSPSGEGLEISFAETHPNDLFVGESASFQLLHDGEPAAGVDVTVIRGDDRYRDEVGEMVTTTDEEGRFELNWGQAGRYWLNTDVQSEGDEYEGIPVTARATYVAVFEVLPF